MHVSSTACGRHAEIMAGAFLSLSGYRIRERNFRYSRLEIDIIAQKANILAVVEVKFRTARKFGGAIVAVDLKKQRDLETAAVGYLNLKRIRGVSIRFDVVVIEALPGNSSGVLIRHIPGAFSASGRYRI